MNLKKFFLGLVAVGIVILVALMITTSMRKSRMEAEIKRLLPGKWSYRIIDDGKQVLGENEYTKDGKFSGTAKVSGEPDFAWEGKWVTKGATVETTIDRSTDNDMIGEVMADEVIEINDTIFKYVADDGEIVTETRKK